MKIYLEQQNKKLNKKFKGSAKKLLSELSISASAVLIIKNGELVVAETISSCGQKTTDFDVPEFKSHRPPGVVGGNTTSPRGFRV